MTCEDIRLQAYYNWLARGCPLNSDPLQDWVKAEQDLARKHFLENPKTHNNGPGKPWWTWIPL